MNFFSLNGIYYAAMCASLLNNLNKIIIRCFYAPLLIYCQTYFYHVMLINTLSILFIYVCRLIDFLFVEGNISFLDYILRLFVLQSVL